MPIHQMMIYHLQRIESNNKHKMLMAPHLPTHYRRLYPLFCPNYQTLIECYASVLVPPTANVYPSPIRI